MTKPRLTILLGAGSTMNLRVSSPVRGMPSTKDVTEAVRSMRLPTAIKTGLPVRWFADQLPSIAGSAEIPIIGHIFSRLHASYLSPASVNFELLLHALEELDPYVFAKTSHDTHDDYRPVLYAFTRLKRRSEFLQEIGFLGSLRRSVVHTILETFLSRQRLLGSDPAHATRALIAKLGERFAISVFTLNYDDIIDQARNVWFDGFDEPIGGGPEDGGRQALRFSPLRFATWHDQEVPLLAHLHGSVRYGYSARALFQAGGNPGEVVKHHDAQAAYNSVTAQSGSDQHTGGHIVSAGTIISGLSKVAKLMSNPVPYGYYYMALIAALARSSRLMIVGYGGGDAHMNTWLAEFARTHGSQFKTVYVGKLSEESAYEMGPERRLIQTFAPTAHLEQISDRPEAAKFQVRESLGVVASGVPMDEATIDEAIKFLE